MGQHGATPLPTALGLAGCKGAVQGCEDTEGYKEMVHSLREVILFTKSGHPHTSWLGTQPKLGCGLIRTTCFGESTCR